MNSLDFHRYGDILVSGSMDTTVKLWDIRRKGCIITYSVSAGGAWAGSAGGQAGAGCCDCRPCDGTLPIGSHGGGQQSAVQP